MVRSLVPSGLLLRNEGACINKCNAEVLRANPVRGSAPRDEGVVLPEPRDESTVKASSFLKRREVFEA